MFKITVGFVQVLTRLAETYRLRFPIPVIVYFNCLQWLEFLDVFSFSSSMQCVHRPTHLEKLVTTTIGSAVVVMLLVLASSARFAALLVQLRATCKRILRTGKKRRAAKAVVPTLGDENSPRRKVYMEVQRLGAQMYKASSSYRKDSAHVNTQLATCLNQSSPSNIAKERWLRAYDQVVRARIHLHGANRSS